MIEPTIDASLGVQRVDEDLIALYTFDTDVVGEIADVSDFGTPLDLAVVGAGNYEVTSEGWNLFGDTLISSKAPALKLVDAVSTTNALSIEAWIRPASTMQTGPARIVCMSKNPSAANFTLAQGAQNGGAESRYIARVRTEASTDDPPGAFTNENVVATEWTHIVFTRAADETITLYRNGEAQVLTQAGSAPNFSGLLGNWDTTYTLNLGDELESTGISRAWHGEYALLAIFQRDLDAEEVTQNFLAGR
jgi:hypothetical protein